MQYYVYFLKLLASFFLCSSAVLLLHHGLAIDLPISNYFFSWDAMNSSIGHWLFPKNNALLTFWLHEVIKWLFITFALSALFAFLLSFYFPFFQPYRRQALCIFLTFLLVSTIVAVMKAHSAHFCPSKLIPYGGYAHDLRATAPLFSLHPEGKCFPAAHPAGAFSLFIFGALATSRHYRILGYGIGFVAGSLVSFIQIARGEHFLSHCLATLLIALWVSWLLSTLQRRPLC